MSYDEAATIERRLEWERNPCGKPTLQLFRTKREEEFRPNPGPCKMVMCTIEPKGADRRAALTNLQGAFHADREFPGRIGSYYEGPHPDEPATSWVIIVYGEGEPFPVKPEPWTPGWMR